MVQESILKWLKANHDKIENHKAYLVKTVKNNCINYMKSIQQRKRELIENVQETIEDRQESFGVWQSEVEAEISERLARMMERLAPVEQMVLVLRESFDFSYSDITKVVNTKLDNCRQIYSRARRRLLDGKVRFKLDVDLHSELTSSLMKAYKSGEVSSLIQKWKGSL